MDVVDVVLSEALAQGVALRLLPPYRVTLAQFNALIAAGRFAPEAKVELIEGWLIEKPMKNAPHEITGNQINYLLNRLLPDGWFVSIENSFLAGADLLIPDVMIVRGHPRDYSGRRTTAADVGLLIEIADTSLEFDRGVKAQVYRRAAVSPYWVVNLPERVIEVYTLAEGAEAYGPPIVYAADASIPLVLAGAEVARLPVADLLPSSES